MTLENFYLDIVKSEKRREFDQKLGKYVGKIGPPLTILSLAENIILSPGYEIYALLGFVSATIGGFASEIARDISKPDQYLEEIYTMVKTSVGESLNIYQLPLSKN